MNLSEIFLTDGTSSPILILWAFYIAVVISAVVYYSVAAQLGKIVSKLLEKDATTPENALDLQQLDIKIGFFTKFCLKSPMNYKNLLVAITPDGTFYANTQYTSVPPVFKQLTAITRKKRSRIKNEKSLSSNPDTTDGNFTILTDSEVENKENKEESNVYLTSKPQRINFNPLAAKYYLPKEVHPRARGIFKSSKTNVLLLIAALLGLAVIIYFAGLIIDDLIASTSNLFK